MKRTVQPPLPTGIGVTELKKRDTAAVREYFRKLTEFAQKSGVLTSFTTALREESFFLDLTGKSPAEFNPKKKSQVSQGLVITGYEEVSQPKFQVVDVQKKIKSCSNKH